MMAMKKYTPEMIIGMLREAEVQLPQGATVKQGCSLPKKSPAKNHDLIPSWEALPNLPELLKLNENQH